MKNIMKSFCRIPPDLYEKGYNKNEREILTYLYIQGNWTNGLVTVSRKKLAKVCDCSESEVRTSLKNIEKKGEIKKTKSSSGARGGTSYKLSRYDDMEIQHVEKPTV